MDFKGYNIKRFLKSFGYAVNGIRAVWKSEQNFRFHTFAMILIIALSFALSISRIEWCIILLLIFGMLSFEIMNTAIEKTVDLVTGEYHPLAKLAKDFAAGAVLLFAIASIIIGTIIFLPKIMDIIH